VARAMSFEAAQSVSGGGKTKERALQIAHRAEELSQKVGHPHAIGLSIWARGVSSYLVGEWKLAAEFCERAAEVLRDRCTGVTWELTMANRFMLSALLYLGELAEVSRRVPSLLSAALEQGNVFAATDLRTRMNSIWLAADDPDKARAEVIEALKAWPHEGFHLQHYSSLLAQAQIELYTGDADVAWKHIAGQWSALENSMLLRTQVLRIEATYLRARAALATSLNNSDRDKLSFAERLAHQIEKENMSWAKPFAVVVRAAVTHQRGQNTEATTLLAAAGDGFERGDMRLYAAASRRRLGELLADDRGRQLIADSDASMTTQRIKNPERMARMLVPGF